jgi:hypothetical protein
MPTTTAIPASNGHQWHMRFDRVVCRNCDVVRGYDDGTKCKGAMKIRPMAGIRQHVSLLGHKPTTDPNFLPVRRT